MNDDNKKGTSPEDEYHFPQEEYVTPHDEKMEEDAESKKIFTDEEEHETSPSGFRNILDRINDIWNHSPIFKNKKIVAVIAIIIVILIAFRLMRPHKTVIIQPQKQAAVQPAPIVQQPQTQNPNQSGLADQLQQVEASRQEQTEQLKSKINILSGTLEQLSSNQADMMQMIHALSLQIKQLSAVVQTLQAQQISASPKLAYHIRAILPGRAWIINNFGMLQTVTLGDMVPQYGIVNSIDPQQGIITTSSGKKIEYGTNDY